VSFACALLEPRTLGRGPEVTRTARRRRAVSFACGLREPRTLWRGPEATRAAGEAPRGVVPYGLCELAALPIALR